MRALKIQNILITLFSLTLITGSISDDKTKKPVSLASIYKGAMAENVKGNEMLEAFLLGTPSLSYRLGYEYSDFDDPGDLDAASGLNIQTRLAYKSNEYKGVSFFLQAQLTSILQEDYRHAHGGDPEHDVIADPDDFRLHQGYVDLTMIPDTQIRLGIQEILLDDVRLFGNVGWRQGAQSFTAASIKNTSIENLTLFAAYVDRIHNINYQDLEDEEFILTNASYKINDKTNVSAFAYFRDGTMDAQDSTTLGVRAWGSFEKILYDITLAQQSDYQDGDHDAHMYNAYIGLKLEKATIGIGYSLISGDASDPEGRFSTLFGTAHKFNGWADQFLGTGGGLTGGLEDIYLEVKALKLPKGLTAVIQYHIFNTDDSSVGFDQYGQEFDILISKKINDNLSMLLKFAHYERKDNVVTNTTRDEDVLWFRVMMKF